VRTLVRERRSWIGTLLSAICFVLALRNVCVAEVIKTLSKANYLLIMVAMVMQTAAIVATAIRWKLLFSHHYAGAQTSRFLSVAFIGELVNTFLPARLGSLVRVFLIGEIGEISKAFALGTIVVEKILDGLTLLFLFALLGLFLPFPGWLRQTGFLTGVIIIGLSASMITIGYQKAKVVTLVSHLLGRLPTLGHMNLLEQFGFALDSLEGLCQARTGLKLWCWSILISILGILVNFTTLAALNIQTPLIAPVFLLIALQIGIKIPSLPGNIGVFEYLCVLSLSLFSINDSLALSFGFLLHFILLLPPSLLGALCLSREDRFRTLGPTAVCSGIRDPERSGGDIDAP